MKKRNESSLKFAQIMGINVLSTTTSEVLARVKNFISHNHQFYIVTPNPELVLMAQKNIQLRNALNGADLPLPDGIGLAQAARYSSLKSPSNPVLRFAAVFLQGVVVGGATFFNKDWLTAKLNILKGREVFLDLISLADREGWRVFFLGGEGQEASLSTEKLKKIYKKIKIESFAGPIVDINAVPVSEVNKRLERDAVDRINKFSPQILFVAMKNPKQEIWIHKNLSKLKVGGAMTVGGTFRYIAGVSKLPPSWMEKLGLEWVWRLITEPYRFKRVLNAFPIFPLKIFWYRFFKQN